MMIFVNGNFVLFHLSSLIIFQPTVEPIEVGALPQYAVLGLEHPVVLVGIDKQLGFYAFHAGGVEGTHALGGIDTVVFLAMDAQYWGIPVVYPTVGRIGIGLLRTGGLVLVPISIVVLPVGEPVLFCLGVHGFQIESAIVGYEALETLVVVTG